jgi:urea transport system permease protein
VNVGTAEGASEPQQSLAQAARASIERIETWAVWSAAIETLFRGVSLSSILLIMSVGLAIIFGLMGVINMAHGELMMVGAYATFMTQEAFRAFLPATMFDYYFAAAMPMAFLGSRLRNVARSDRHSLPLWPAAETMWRLGASVSCHAGAAVFGDLTAVTAGGSAAGFKWVGVYAQ